MESFVIKGEHNLKNPSYLIAIYSVAIEQFEYLEVDEYSTFSMANLIVERLSLPKTESMLAMYALSNRSNVSKKEIEQKLTLIRIKANATIQKEQNAGTKEDDFENNQSVEMSKQKTLEIAKTTIMDVINKRKIVPDEYLIKKIGQLLAKLNVSLETFISVNFSLSYISHNPSKKLTYKGGVEPSVESIIDIELEKSHHRPIQIENIAELYDIGLDEATKRIKQKKVGSLIMWTDFSAWTTRDIRLDEAKKAKLNALVKRSGGGYLLLKDIFHILFVGIIPEQDYELIELSSKETCARFALNSIGYTNYQFDNVSCRFSPTKHAEQKKEKNHMYVDFWED